MSVILNCYCVISSNRGSDTLLLPANYVVEEEDVVYSINSIFNGQIFENLVKEVTSNSKAFLQINSTNYERGYFNTKVTIVYSYNKSEYGLEIPFNVFPNKKSILNKVQMLYFARELSNHESTLYANTIAEASETVEFKVFIHNIDYNV